MSYDFYQYSEKMRNYLQLLEKRIKDLEKQVAALTIDLTTIKEKPTVHIDRIDYSFDQLKVETLEGTLNIGLNPEDLSNIEELAINQNSPINQPHAPFYPPIDPKQMMNRSMDIEEEMNQFIQLELPDIIRKKQTELNMPEEESYVTFIQDDINKQLPTRIQYYLQQGANRKQNGNNLSNEAIIQALKEEMENGVHLFLSHIPDNMKGSGNE
ncbi:spore gernimation protein [Cytobacillus oceanisediminis]|uniref:Spore gernimation protein n=1 Tax=Niallia alba TaxID=2729105 RepID=A0A7Y0K721_9BACI|nr:MULTISPECIES: spore germination protein GerPC [Bacillaceae]EOR24877.1 spore germination protein GerPC [Niallia nealsonii AAU1]MBQ6447913.1 spore gernimation protein [Bacillus sp. (in: firmicutes)]MBZ9533168.1 spore gernimation protein [Cytobacillus oceanisediminis]NMO76708.1 spore gernimation protein [Niallia alba]UTI39906.1 spore germination protein GerPC [Niallia sp. RD1]